MLSTVAILIGSAIAPAEHHGIEFPSLRFGCAGKLLKKSGASGVPLVFLNQYANEPRHSKHTSFATHLRTALSRLTLAPVRLARRLFWTRPRTPTITRARCLLFQ